MQNNYLYNFLPDELIDEIFFIVHKENFKESLGKINEIYIREIQVQKLIDIIIEGVLNRLNNNNLIS